MKESYRATCKNCGRQFRSLKLKKMVLVNDESGLKIEIDLANVIQNGYHQEVDTQQGKVTLDLKDLGMSISCPHCKTSGSYTLKELVLTDRLD